MAAFRFRVCLHVVLIKQGSFCIKQLDRMFVILLFMLLNLQLLEHDCPSPD